MKRHLWMLLALFSGSAMAHPTNECVQAAYLTLAANQITLELDLTPGELVAGKLIALIDMNRDGTSPAESESFAQSVLRQVSLEVDGQVQELKLQNITMPDSKVFESGGGTVRIDARAELTSSAGDHQFIFRNGFKPVKSGYLANVFVQSGEVKILGQQRDATQQDFRVRYSLEPRAPRFDWVWFPAILAPTALIAWWLTRTKRRHSELSGELPQH